MSTQNLHIYVYGGFTHNCSNLEAPKMSSVSDLINKLQNIKKPEYSALKNNELSSHEDVRKPKCI